MTRIIFEYFKKNLTVLSSAVNRHTFHHLSFSVWLYLYTHFTKQLFINVSFNVNLKLYMFMFECMTIVRQNTFLFIAIHFWNIYIYTWNCILFEWKLLFSCVLRYLTILRILLIFSIPKRIYLRRNNFY